MKCLNKKMLIIEFLRPLDDFNEWWAEYAEAKAKGMVLAARYMNGDDDDNEQL